MVFMPKCFKSVTNGHRAGSTGPPGRGRAGPGRPSEEGPATDRTKNTIFCGHRVDPTRGDFYVGCPSKLPAEVTNVRHGPRRGHPQNPKLLKKCAPAGGCLVPAGEGGPWASPGLLRSDLVDVL
eukprot:gene13278-biopygen8008